jgi:dTDP-4-dehydrorhamnose reductase
MLMSSSMLQPTDGAETDEVMARVINAKVAVQPEAAVSGALVHFSTDYVFDGSGHRA